MTMDELARGLALLAHAERNALAEAVAQRA